MKARLFSACVANQVHNLMILCDFVEHFQRAFRMLIIFCWQNEFKRTSPENSHAVCACSLMSSAQEKPINERFFFVLQHEF